MAYHLPIDEIELDLELVSRPGGLHRFMEMAWHVVESQPFVDGWHLEETCEHLEAVSAGRCKRLLINIPPGCTKSMTVSVMWPVWDWITHPWRKFMYSSFDASLSQRDALRAKELIQSEWFQARWGILANQKLLEKKKLGSLFVISEGKQNTATVYWTSGGGFRFSTSVAGRSTGWHSHIQVTDDPTKPKDVQAGGKTAIRALQSTIDWWKGTMSSRKVDPNSFSRVVIMQRLHEMDLAGHLEKEGGYTVLKLPMEYKPESPCRTPFGGDRRTEPGELLWPERFSAAAVVETKKEMGPRVAAAQLQQEPSPEGGQIFKRAWFNNRWRQLPTGGKMIQSWDCSFKDSDGSDYVVGQVWLYVLANFYLIHQVRDRMDLPTTVHAIRDMRRLYPRARTIVIEDKANGPAVEQTLRDEISGIVMVDPQGGKIARANAVSGYYEAGNVWLPEDAPWVPEHIDNMAGFPMRQFDDEVDSASQALLYLTGKTVSRLRQAMDKVRSNG